jgi:hypothetical protein
LIPVSNTNCISLPSQQIEKKGKNNVRFKQDMGTASREHFTVTNGIQEESFLTNSISTVASPIPRQAN